MKRIVFLLVALIAMMTSCDTYQAKRDIKEYEEQNRTMKVAKIKVKHVESTCIYVAKIQYGVKFDNGAKLTSEPVFHVYKWDKYGYLSEMEDCEEKFETIEYYFPEAIYVDDYVVVKCFWQWMHDNKTKDITYYIKKIKDERK